MLSFEEANESVTVVVIDPDGNKYAISARFMVAADGHRSSIKAQLGIPVSGVGHINTVRGVLFYADLDKYLAKGYSHFQIKQPSVEAFLTTYRDARWVLMFSDDIDRSADEQRQAVLTAVGEPDLDFETITTGRWELKGAVADAFQ